MSENMRIYDKVREVPKEALKAIMGGRLKGMSDINPMWRLKMLTELFGPCGFGWRIEITDKRLERGEGVEIVCFVDINLYIKVDGEWSAPIPGMGGSSFVTQEQRGPFTSDECFKMAYTDAISVACKSLGFAADVYFANDRTKYSDNPNGGESTNERSTRTNTNARTSPQPSRQPDNKSNSATASSGQSGKPQSINSKSSVIAMMNEMKWDWNALGQFASEVLGRKIGRVLQDIKTEDEWNQVEDQLRITKEAS